MKFEHFIITQFNVKFKWQRGKLTTGNKIPSREWMVDRLKLFEKFCYPSIINQTNQNFKWLVFFHGTRTRKKEIEKYKRLIPIYMKDYTDWNFTNINEAIKQHSSTNSDYIITSRLDNDDSYGVNYINDAQSYINTMRSSHKILNFTNGRILSLENNILHQYRYMCTNPFISLIEKNTELLKTCFYVDHPEMRSIVGNVEDVSTEYPAWLQVIHGKNLGNHEVRGTRIQLKDLHRLFGCEELG